MMNNTSEDSWKKPFVEVISFDKTDAFKALQKQANNPFDLSKEGAVSKERIDSMREEGAGLNLLYGFERITPEVRDQLIELAKERKALEQMRIMQSGDPINFIEDYESEKRSVLHTATRDLFNDPN